LKALQRLVSVDRSYSLYLWSLTRDSAVSGRDSALSAQIKHCHVPSRTVPHDNEVTVCRSQPTCVLAYQPADVHSFTFTALSRVQLRSSCRALFPLTAPFLVP